MQIKLPKKSKVEKAKDVESLDQKRQLEKKTIKYIVTKNDDHLIPFDSVMKLLVTGKAMPRFVRLTTRNEITDGFMISGC